MTFMGGRKSGTRRRPGSRRAPVAPERVFGLAPPDADMLAVGIIAAVTLLRLVYTLAIADYAAMSFPDSGPDAPAYAFVAEGMHQRGVLASGLEGVPFWPAGYPMFLAAVYSWLGQDVVGPIVVQQLMLSAGMFSAYRLAARELSREVALVAVALMALAPALQFSATVFMYEPLLAVAAVVGADLVSSAARRREPGKVLSRAVAAMAVMGLGAMLQPKLLALAPMYVVWLVWRTRRWAVVLPCVLALALGPTVLVLRNVAADGAPVMSANLGFTMLMGFNDQARGGYVSDVAVARACGGRAVDVDPELDHEWRACAVDWALRHPVRAVLLTPAKAAHFWMPMAGTLATYGTWRHPLDPQRWLPDRLERGPATRAAGAALGIGWMALTLVLVARGAARALSRWRPGALLLLAPLVVFLAVSLVTLGDARFRIPVTPFSAILVAVALHRPVGRLLARVTK